MVHIVQPRRRNPSPEYDNYRSYKIYLREDFTYFCGYCTVHENEWGGPRHFHVEHFRPKSLFPDLETDYENLLYACDVCNVFKSNDWPSDDPVAEGEGYLDPCEHDYNEHFEVVGDILEGSSDVAEYMIERLHLNRRQLRKLRAMRNRAEHNHQRAVARITEIIDSIEESLADDDLSKQARQTLMKSQEAFVSQLEQLRNEWQSRWEPLYDLDDYR